MRRRNAFARLQSSGGFTLLEVMIALAVVSIGLVAASSSIAQITANGVYLRDKTFGHWIIMNKLSEMRLADTWPATGKTDDEMDYGGQHWHWTAEVTPTDVETLRRIDLTVARKDKNSERLVAKLSGFVGKPRIGAGLPAPWTGMAAQGPGQPGGHDQGNPGTQPPAGDQGDEDSDQDSGNGDDNGGDDNGDQSGDQEQQ